MTRPLFLGIIDRMASKQLPPLTWLRAFEAAGRFQSFRAAAEELHLSPSAISHHIRSLEEYLAKPLFQRTGNRVILTLEGSAYLAEVSAGFTRLKNAAHVIDNFDPQKQLTIGAFPFLVNESLLPNLNQLREMLGGREISVVSDTRLEQLTAADPNKRVDAIIRYGNGKFPGCTAVKLTDITLVPVASPELIERVGADRLLAEGTRIIVDGPFKGWDTWARGAKVNFAENTSKLSFDSFVTALQAAEHGLGITLGIRPFVDEWLNQGRLATVTDQHINAGQGSYLVMARHDNLRTDLALLTTWLTNLFDN